MDLAWPIVMMAPPPKRTRPLRAQPDPQGSQEPPRPSRAPRITRDLVLFMTGLGLTINEAAIRSAEPRTQLLILYAGMMGLPAIFQADGALAQLLRRDPPK